MTESPKRFFAFLLFSMAFHLCIIFWMQAAPLTPQKPEEEKLPDLAGKTNWGLLTQEGRNFAITGHPQWQALGEIRKDGKVTIIWSQNSDGAFCPGVYEIRKIDNAMVGVWGRAPEAYINAKGELEGPTQGDVTYRVKE